MPRKSLAWIISLDRLNVVSFRHHLSLLSVHGNQFGVDCREETIAFENFRTCRRENALREDHDGIVLDASPRLMISHSGMGQPGSGMKDAKRSRSKLTRGY